MNTKFDNLNNFSYPLPEDIERMVYSGQLKRAENVIEKRLNDNRTPDVLKERLRLEKAIISSIRSSYTLTEDEVFSRLKSLVTDFTDDEFKALTDDGTLDWVLIEGRVYFESICVESFLKTRPDYYTRLSDQSYVREKAETTEKLNAMIDKMKRIGSVHLRYHIRETMSFSDMPERYGEKIRAWLPLPSRELQSIPGEILSVSHSDASAGSEDEMQRTVYFEDTYEKGKEFTVEFTFDNISHYVNPDPDAVLEEQPSFCTEEVLPQLAVSPYIRALAEELAGDIDNPLLKARRFYDYVTRNCCYRFVPPYFTKTYIPEYFGAGQRGDCGMHALTFIALCRAAGIPAKWQSGWYTNPDGIGNHDWACFYIEPYGWLFADGSFGGSAYRDGDMDRWNFYFGNLEPWRMVSNRDIQQKFAPEFPFLRNDPYDNQTGEACFTDRALGTSEYTLKREIVSIEEI